MLRHTGFNLNCDKITEYRVQSNGNLVFNVRCTECPLSGDLSNHSESTRKYNEVENGYIPEKVVDVLKNKETNELICLVRCKGYSDLKYFPANVMNNNYAEMMIKFYESRITWRTKN